MRPAASLGVLVLAASPAIAWAEHDHAHMQHDEAPAPGDARDVRITGMFGVVAASYSNTLYAGDYQGVRLGLGVARGPFEVGLELPAYRLRKNGLLLRGIGDVGVHASWSALQRPHGAVGIAAMAGIPTGNATDGLGMGHLMLMGHVYGTWTAGRTTLTGAVGYARALGSASEHANHGGGTWPLVDPMTTSELTASASVARALGASLSAGAGVTYAEPLDLGERRLVVEAGLGWHRGRYGGRGTFAAGVMGEPFDLRGMMSATAAF